MIAMVMIIMIVMVITMAIVFNTIRNQGAHPNRRFCVFQVILMLITVVLALWWLGRRGVGDRFA